MKRLFQTDLINDNITRALITFAFPILISSLFQQLYNTVDTMIVGHMLGDISLAAIGSCSALYELLIGFSLGFGTGFSIVASRYFGAGNKKVLKKAVSGAIVLGAVISLCFAVLGSIFLKPLLILLDTPETILQESYSYISIIISGIGVLFAFNLCAGLLRAIGDSTAPLIFLIFASILNVFLDYVFIRFLGMGVSGTAVATIIAQGLSSLFCILFILSRKKLLVPGLRDFIPDRRLWTELMLQGCSMGFTMMIVHIGSTIIQRSLNQLGEAYIAAQISGRKIYSILLMPLNAVPSALATFVSQNFGAGKKERILKGYHTANIICIAWSLFTILISFTLGGAMVRLVSGSSDPAILHYGTRYVQINSIFYSFLGVLLNIRFLMQGIGHNAVPVISSAIELICKILFAAFIIPILHYTGVIICEPITWVAMTIYLLIALKHYIHKDFS